MQHFANKDNRIVMTLDAGGTNFVYSAIQRNRPLVEPVQIKPYPNDLDKCIKSMIAGFEMIKEKLSDTPAAISFAFPGPADYPNGIIGDLPNFPAFLGGTALGPMLEHHFGIPVYINNDGNLFAYGEALFGFLPELNESLVMANSNKRYHNLIGITLGTGFGVGLVSNNKLVTGDNSNGGEGWLLRDILSKNSYVEDHLSREGLRRNYASKSGIQLNEVGMPSDIYRIAKNEVPGDGKAARLVFQEFGMVLGEACATLISLIDGVVVLGGGISSAFDLFAPSMFKQLVSKYKLPNGKTTNRLPQKVYNLDDPEELESFLQEEYREITIPNTDKKMTYNPYFKTGVGVSKHDTALMIALGAYAFALQKLDEKKEIKPLPY